MATIISLGMFVERECRNSLASVQALLVCRLTVCPLVATLLLVGALGPGLSDGGLPTDLTGLAANSEKVQLQSGTPLRTRAVLIGY